MMPVSFGADPYYGGSQPTAGNIYWNNRSLGQLWVSGLGVMWVKDQMVPDPSATILLTEKTGGSMVQSVTDINGGDHPYYFWPIQQGVYSVDLHEGIKFNYLFSDGHVERLDVTDTVDGDTIPFTWSYANQNWTLRPSDYN